MLDDTIDASTVSRDVGTCPVKHFTVFEDQDAGQYWVEAAALREETPAFFNNHAQGYWVVTRYDAVKDLYQSVDLFSSESFTAWEPNPPYRFVPTQIDPPEHIKYRQLLNPKFSPGAVARAEEPSREIARRMIAEIAPTGGCDFVAEFAIRFPTEVFLTVIGLPTEDADQLVAWVEGFFHGLNGAEEFQSGMVGALEGIRGYFVDVLAERRAEPARSGDRPRVAPAGLDGRRRAAHRCGAARHVHRPRARRAGHHPGPARLPVPVPRRASRRPSADPRRSVAHAGVHRGVAADACDHHRRRPQGDARRGLPWLPGEGRRHGDGPGGRRQPRPAPLRRTPDEFRLDRTGNHHFGFAGGPHRCLGAHLARREMLIAVEEWHAAIPHYRIESDEPLQERGGQLALLSLPLAWDVTNDGEGTTT